MGGRVVYDRYKGFIIQTRAFSTSDLEGRYVCVGDFSGELRLMKYRLVSSEGNSNGNGNTKNRNRAKSKTEFTLKLNGLHGSNFGEPPKVRILFFPNPETPKPQRLYY